MPSSFDVTFRDHSTMTIYDIICFEQFQIDQIREIASKTTRKQLRDVIKKGHDIKNLTHKQKQVALKEKNTIVSVGKSKFLFDNGLVLFSVHALERVELREGETNEAKFIEIIYRLKRTNRIHKAQWKAHPQLSFSFMENGDPERYRIPVAFEQVGIGGRIMSVMTVSKTSSEKPERMESRLGEDKGDLFNEILRRLGK